MLKYGRSIRDGKMATLVRGTVRSRYGQVSVYAIQVYGESANVRLTIKAGARTETQAVSIKPVPVDRLMKQIETKARKFAKEING